MFVNLSIRFSETIKLFKRLSTTNTTATVQDGEGGTLDDFVKKGNERLRSKDPHTCCLCKTVLTTRHNLKSHMKIVHCGENALPPSNETFASSSENKNGDPRRGAARVTFTCILCDYKTELKGDFYGHTLTHIKGKCMKSRFSK